MTLSVRKLLIYGGILLSPFVGAGLMYTLPGLWSLTLPVTPFLALGFVFSSLTQLGAACQGHPTAFLAQTTLKCRATIAGAIGRCTSGQLLSKHRCSFGPPSLLCTPPIS